MTGRLTLPVPPFFLTAIIAVVAVPLASCGSRPVPEEAISKGSPTLEVQGVSSLAALNLDSFGRVLRGYDPVAYFEENRAIPGKAEFSFFWKGGDWHFNSPENRARFAANPEKYAPENGGYCTFGVVLSKKFDIDPTVWLLHREKLYVFLSEDVKEKFLQDRAGNLQRVHANWPSIEKEFPEEL